MANQTGIAIVIKAFLPTGKSLDEQFAALSAVKTAHETGDYSELLKAATIEEVKTEQKTRRIGAPQTDGGTLDLSDTDLSSFDGAQTEEDVSDQPEHGTEDVADADVPAFLKKGKQASTRK